MINSKSLVQIHQLNCQMYIIYMELLVLMYLKE